MGTILAIVVLGGLILSACLALGEAAPAGADDGSIADRLDKMDFSEPKEGEVADTPAEKPAPAEPSPPDQTAAKPEPSDRTGAWTGRMKTWEKYIPEAERRSYLNSVEQAERWGKKEGGAALDELQGRLGSAEAAAKALAEQFSDGPAELEKLGPAGFLKKLTEVDLKTLFTAINDANAEQDDEPAPEPAAAPKPEGEQSALEKRIAAMEAKEAERAAAAKKEHDELKLKKAEAAFEAEFRPAHKEAVTAWDLPEAEREKVGQEFENLAKACFVAMSHENPRTATAKEAVQKTRAMVDAIVSARESKKPRRPEGTVTVDPTKARDDQVAKPVTGGVELSWNDRLNKMGDDIVSDALTGKPK